MVALAIVEEREPAGRNLKIEQVDLVNPKEITRAAVAGRHSSAQSDGADAHRTFAFEISDGPSHPRLRAVITSRRAMRFGIQKLRAMIDGAVDQLARRSALVGVRRIVDAQYSVIIADRREIASIFQMLLIAQVHGQRDRENDHRDADALDTLDRFPFAGRNPQNNRN